MKREEHIKSFSYLSAFFTEVESVFQTERSFAQGEVEKRTINTMADMIWRYKSGLAGYDSIRQWGHLAELCVPFSGYSPIKSTAISGYLLHKLQKIMAMQVSFILISFLAICFYPCSRSGFPNREDTSRKIKITQFLNFIMISCFSREGIPSVEFVHILKQ